VKSLKTKKQSRSSRVWHRCICLHLFTHMTTITTHDRSYQRLWRVLVIQNTPYFTCQSFLIWTQVPSMHIKISVFPLPIGTTRRSTCILSTTLHGLQYVTGRATRLPGQLSDQCQCSFDTISKISNVFREYLLATMRLRPLLVVLPIS
jgi:hypothetical protein